jgi:EAL domain-containing protein (putative c-di-GMP-specific phosphodiesterase class I)
MIELESSDCVAFEALTRFPDEPERETSEWFATANELGLGSDLELAAIREALTHFAELPESTSLALNVSAATAISPRFFALVGSIADRLIIELTEHDPVQDYRELETALARLRRLGARIAIDDVGAGFASLRHILRLRPDILKLDLTLTREIETDRSSRAITSALVQFAKTTDVLIAAEGIETQRELDVLRELGVDHGQGYFLGRPSPLTPLLH